MAKVNRQLEMQVPAPALYKVITDFEAYPEFLPEVVSASLAKGSNREKTIVAFELELVRRFQYSLEFRTLPETEVHWNLKESNFFKKNEGFWKLTPNGDTVEVEYSLDVDFGFMVPKFISKKLTEVSLPKMFQIFEARAEGMNDA